LREIGIRLALGAVPGQVFTAVIFDVALYAGFGFVLACPAAWYISGLFSDLLYRVERLDQWSIVLACLGMAATVLIAAALPARRASQIEPAATLRGD
jgi:ABC-type antimicrobial peptide transport system permease subunit